MIKSRLLTGVALAALCLPVAALVPSLPFGASAAQAQSANVSFQLFFDQLEPHGVWVQHAKYRYVFCPTGVDTAWRPYTNGRWLYVEGRGWYFASDEPFAWATYHYGRWFADPSLGWCWVPGNHWAPAWVSWRRSDTVVGWAPLPPEGDGYAVSIQVSRSDLPEGYWVFVPTERFVEPNLMASVVVGSQQPDYYAQTQFLGPVTVEGDLVVNNVIDVTYIEQTINQQVIVYRPQEVESPSSQSVNVQDQAISIFDANVAEPSELEAPADVLEETEATGKIETDGGTAGATVGLSAQDAGAIEQPAADTAADAPTAEQPAVDEPTAEPSKKPAATEGLLCSSENMVEGTCAQTEQQPARQPGEQPTDQGQAETAPAETVPPTSTTEAPSAPVEQEPAQPEPEGAPVEQPATASSNDQALCPPEQMVEGSCPVPGGAEAPLK